MDMPRIGITHTRLQWNAIGKDQTLTAEEKDKRLDQAIRDIEQLYIWIDGLYKQHEHNTIFGRD